MNVKPYIPMIALSVLLIILILIFFLGGEDKDLTLESVSVSDESISDAEAVRETQKIVLFFPSEEDDLLHPEERLISASNPNEEVPLVDQVRRVVEELLKGPQNGAISPFPPETQVRELFMADRGVVYVDFTREFQDLHVSGSAAELATVYSIVNSITHNLNEVKRVFILVNGGEQETLKGHIDLTRPLLPRNDLIFN